MSSIVGVILALLFLGTAFKASENHSASVTASTCPGFTGHDCQACLQNVRLLSNAILLGPSASDPKQAISSLMPRHAKRFRKMRALRHKCSKCLVLNTVLAMRNVYPSWRHDNVISGFSFASL